MDATEIEIQGTRDLEGIAESQESPDASERTCGLDRLPSEIFAQVLELVVKLAWRDDERRAPNAVEMGRFPVTKGHDDAHGTGSHVIAKTYPTPFLLVCRRWYTITLETPTLWSYLMATDNSTTDGISLYLDRSKASPLSIRLSYLSEVTEEDEEDSRSEQQLLQALFGPPRRPQNSEDASLHSLDLNVDKTEIQLLEEKMNLLLQHAKRWSRFHFSASQLRFIHHSAKLVTENSQNIHHLVEYSLKFADNHRCDFFDVLYSGRKTAWFSNPMPVLQRLALFCGGTRIIPSTSPRSAQVLFPALKELEVTQLRGSRAFSSLLELLDNLPQLRSIRLIHIETDEEVFLRQTSESVRIAVLEHLEELTVQDSDWTSLKCVLKFLSLPNIQTLSFIKTEIHDINAFAGVAQELPYLTNLRRLCLKGVWFTVVKRILRFGVKPDLETTSRYWQSSLKLLSAMPEVTSIHLDSGTKFLAEPLIRPHFGMLGVRATRFTDSPLLPKLTEISFSGFSGDEIINIVSGRRELGVPLKALHIDKTLIPSGDVTFEHWEYLLGEVETLSWFENDELQVGCTCASRAAR